MDNLNTCAGSVRAMARDKPPVHVTEALPNRPQTILFRVAAGLPSRTKGYFFRAAGAKKIRQNVLKVTIFLSKNRI